MTILYTNGCSYTANFDLERKNTYPAILADRLEWKLVDKSEPGSCNSRIIRTTIDDCVKLRSQTDEKIVALIQLSHLFRTEYPTDNLSADPFCSVKPTAPNNSNSQTPEPAGKYADYYWRLHSNHHLLVNLITDLIGLISYFKQNNVEYLIYLGPNENSIYADVIGNDLRFKLVNSDPHVLDLTEFNMLDLTGEQTHPTADGMRAIADYFFNLLCEPA